MFIKSANISVVVQGAIGTNTEQCLQSVRRFLPSAEIVLSTWVGADTTNLDYDKLIDKQIEKAGISIRAGFAKIFAGAIKIISVSQ